MSLRELTRAGSLVAALGLASLAAGVAQAKTCTVDLDQLQQVRADITDLLRKDVHVDHDQGKALRRKFLEELQSGHVTVDPKDLKGVVSVDPKAAATMVRRLLVEVEGIVESCGK